MTDFGAPEAIPACDNQPLDKDELGRSRALLRAAWRAFDAAVASARGKTLTTGPRGGKRVPARFFVRRSMWHILDHVWEIEDRSSSPEDK